MMFEQMIEGWFGRCRMVNHAFLRALMDNDLNTMNVYMNKLTEEMFSYFDTGNSSSGEE